MLSEKWKVILILCGAACAYGGPSRALAPYSRRRHVPLFVARNKRKSRVAFLDDAERVAPIGRGEIDLTRTRMKFDDAADYDFTSDATDPPSGVERYYDPRLRPGLRYRPYAYPDYPARSLYQPQSGWKARTPRVVFPYQETGVNSLTQTNSHAGPTADNVVFREQNFGLSDVPTDDLALQDIGAGAGTGADAFAERDAIVPHRTRNNDTNRMDSSTTADNNHRPLTKPMFIQTDGIRKLSAGKTNYFVNASRLSDELPHFKPISDDQIRIADEILGRKRKNGAKPAQPLSANRKGRLVDSKGFERRDEKTCPQGGTCEFFVYCWMVGGLLEGTCGGLLKGCCHRVAKSGILGVQDSNSIEATNDVNYGPVLNDLSK